MSAWAHGAGAAAAASAQGNTHRSPLDLVSLTTKSSETTWLPLALPSVLFAARSTPCREEPDAAAAPAPPPPPPAPPSKPVAMANMRTSMGDLGVVAKDQPAAAQAA
jgi:hypothetical protein